MFVCESRAVGMETLVIIRWRDVTVPNGSLCDRQCGHFLFSTCPTWLPLAEEIEEAAFHLRPNIKKEKKMKSGIENQLSQRSER